MNFIKYLLSLVVFISVNGIPQPAQPEHPNVIMIITDDQGFGDFGFTGNHHAYTPTLDTLAQENLLFNNYYVSPVCAPTRASLMTGRYSLRTGVRDTYNGGAIMATEEVTIAEILKGAGYKTGIFGKWHLGDNYPSRPSDQGFDESLIHLAGGMGQVGDYTTYYKKDRSYFDPVLWKNNKKKQYDGYCSNIFTDNAIKFIEENKDEPFFCYLSFNAPHTPLQVPLPYYFNFSEKDPSKGFVQEGIPFEKMSEKDKEDARKVYAMVNNIDDNLDILFQKLEELGIEDNTMIIFMSDNGPQQVRYVSGHRGRKGSVYEGGIKVPLIVKYPPLIKKHELVSSLTAHIDILPTIAEICNVPLPKGVKLDGRSFVDQMKPATPPIEDRDLFFYWSRTKPKLYSNMALRTHDYKLVANSNYDESISEFELFRIRKDLYEENDLSTKNPEKTIELRDKMYALYKELTEEYHIKNQPLIRVGTPHENPTVLNRNDAGGDLGIWAQEEIHGKWNVHVEKGVYNIVFKFVKPIPKGGMMMITAGPYFKQSINYTETDLIKARKIRLPDFKGDFTPVYQVDGKSIFPFWVKLERVGD